MKEIRCILIGGYFVSDDKIYVRGRYSHLYKSFWCWDISKRESVLFDGDCKVTPSNYDDFVYRNIAK